MAGPYGKLKADHLVWWDPTIDPNTGVAIGDVEKTLEDISDKATVANPEFTGNVKLTAQGELRLADSDSSNHVGFKSPAVVASDVVWTLPATDGSVAGQMLTTNGAGVLSWSTTDLSDYALKTGTTFSGTVATVNHTDIDASITTLNTSLSGKADLTGANFTGDVDIAAGDKLTLGSDYEIYDTSTELRIESLAGHMRHKLPASQSVLIEGPTGSIAKFTEGGACELYHDDEIKLETNTDGITVSSSQPRVGGIVNFGSSNNCKIEIYDDYASSANNYDNETLKIYSAHGGNNTTKTSIIYEGMHDQTWRAISSAHSPSAELGRVNYNGGWELYYHDIQGTVNNSFAGSTCTKKLETTIDGVTVTGDITAVDLTLSGDLTAVDATITGNLTVNGTTTEVNSTTLTVDDKNIELGKGTGSAITGQSATLTAGVNTVTVASTTGYLPKAALTNLTGTANAFGSATPFVKSITSSTEFTVGDGAGNDLNHVNSGAVGFDVGPASDFTADGGGITLKGSTDKTILWSDTTDSWDFNQDIKTSGTVSDSLGDVRIVPQLSKSAQHTIVVGDAGQHSINSSGGWVIDTSTAFTEGMAITLINNSPTDQTITSTGVTLYNSADPATTPTTLASRGMATVLCTAPNVYYISGAGLS